MINFQHYKTLDRRQIRIKLGTSLITNSHEFYASVLVDEHSQTEQTAPAVKHKHVRLWLTQKCYRGRFSFNPFQLNLVLPSDPKGGRENSAKRMVHKSAVHGAFWPSRNSTWLGNPQNTDHRTGHRIRHVDWQCTPTTIESTWVMGFPDIYLSSRSHANIHIERNWLTYRYFGRAAASRRPSRVI